jgi:DNA repair exonuclease SbcCD nuclease subunit
MILFADLHLDEDSADVVFGEVLPGIRDAALRLKDPVVACLGDFYNLRYQVKVEIQNAVLDELKIWIKSGIRFRLLPGNHDQVDVHGRNALEVFDELGPKCEVYTHPQWDEFGLWLPYRRYAKDVVSALAMQWPVFHAKGKAALFGHFGVQGAQMNDFVEDKDGLPASLFGDFGTVLLGHYHKRQSFGSLHYIGSPRQVTAHEAGQPKGYAVWDGASLRFVDTSWGKRFHRIRLEKGESLETKDFRPGDDVRLSVAPGVQVEALATQLTGLGVQHTVTPDVEVSEKRLDVEPHADLREYARAYAMQVPTDLDRERLLRVFEELAQCDC